MREQAAPWDYPANAARVFHDGGDGGVWLRSGWYPSEPTGHGPGN